MMAEENTDSTILTGSTDSPIGKPASEETSPPSSSSAEPDSEPLTDEPVNSDSPTEGEKPEGNPSDEKPSEDAPVEYAEFTVPEGQEVDKEMLAAALPIFQKLKLSQEDAQALVDLQAQSVQQGIQAQVDSFNQTVADWKAASRNDAEFGGDNFGPNIAIAQNAVNVFGTPELKQFLDETGAGNHPEFVRFMWKVGSKLIQDNPSDTGRAPQGAKDRVEVLYPTNN